MRLGEPSRVQSVINVTPLVDVVLVLLIIFMVVAPQMRPGPDVDLPETAKPPGQGEDGSRLLVTIDERGAVWIDDLPVTADRFAEGLRAVPGAQSDTKVVIQGDARLRFGDVRQAMVAIQNAGYQRVGLLAKRVGSDARGG